jgi:hypothetical protein
LLLGLGSLAVLARPNGASTPSAPEAAAQLGASQQTASQPAVAAPSAPAAPAAGAQNYNMIAMPLDASNQFSSNSPSLPFTANGLGKLLGTGVVEVSKLRPDAQAYLTWYPEIEDGDDFNLEVGGAYWLLLASGASSSISFVGDVPDQGTVQMTLVRPTSGAGCLYNDISIPLDQDAITTPQQLADAIGNVAEVAQLNAANQGFLVWYPEIMDGDNFTIRIGYPYRLCLKVGGATIWP